MDIGDIAASAVKKITTGKGKRLGKKGYPEDLPKIQPTKIENKKDNKYDVGFSMKEVMPDDFESKKYYIAGHKTAQDMTGFHDPITVRAMWLGCDDEGGIVMVSADVIGLTNSENQIIRAGLADFMKKSNCKAVNVCCTHTHGGFDTLGYWGKLPKTGKVDTYMNKLLKSIEEVCVEAYENRVKGDLFIGTAHVPNAQYDKRPPVVLHDTLTRIRFVPDDGSKETWFLNFAAHPNTLGGKNTLCSADYPYFLRERIYQDKDVNVLFGVGAIGGVDPGYPEIEDKWQRTEKQGITLAEAALSIDNDKKMEPEITVLQQPFYFYADNPVLTFLGMLKVMSSKMVAAKKGDLGIALVSEMTYIKLGSQQIVLMPGELFPEIAYGGAASAEDSATGRGPEINPKSLVEIAEDEELLVFGNTNDMTGYVVAPNDFTLHKTQPYLSNGKDRFDRGHYHETNSMGYSAAQTLTDVFADIIKRVK